MPSSRVLIVGGNAKCRFARLLELRGPDDRVLTADMLSPAVWIERTTLCLQHWLSAEPAHAGGRVLVVLPCPSSTARMILGIRAREFEIVDLDAS
jgi:hypothetical protein